MHASNYGNFTATIIPFRKQRFLWLIGLLPSFGIDSDNEVATEQLTAVGTRIDFTFMQHDDPEIS